MKEKEIEPGLLRAFRIYAGLRIVLLLVSIATQSLFFSNRPGNTEEPENYLLIMGLIFISMLLLGFYLSSDWLKEKSGRVYLPLALVFAASSLILEQRWLSPSSNIWQPESFFFVLLIFVAWQYDFKIVLGFILAFLSVEYFVSPKTPYGFGERAKELENASFIMFNMGRLIARFLSSIVLGLITTQLVQAQREHRKSLQDTNQLLLQNATTTERLAISHERERISRELHDTLAHTLSGMTVQLDAVLGSWKNIPANTTILLEKMLDTSRTGLEETRRALQNLRSSPLENLGIGLALRKIAEETATRNALTVKIDIPKKIKQLPPQAEQGFYRIAQEALENIVRHSNAQTFSLIVEEMERNISMTITDDGNGFNINKVGSEKLGLKGMYERAEIIEARLTISSAVGGGTTLSLKKDF